MRVTGQALGIALSAPVVATRLPVYLASTSGTPSAAQQGAALVAAIGDAFVVAAAVCAVGIETSLIRGGGRRVMPEPAGTATLPSA
jgi:hypothetical protein